VGVKLTDAVLSAYIQACRPLAAALPALQEWEGRGGGSVGQGVGKGVCRWL